MLRFVWEGCYKRLRDLFGACATLSAAAVLAAGCGSSTPAAGPTNGPAAFVGRTSNAVLYIQWTRKGNTVAGDVQEAILNALAGSGVADEQASFTGTISGTGVTLQLAQNIDSTNSLVGRITRSGMTITFPGESSNLTTIDFQAGGTSLYNIDVSQLELSQYSSPCELYVQGHDATITISGPSAATDCASLVSQWNADAPLTTQSQGNAAGLSQVCDLVSDSDSDRVVVNDDGEQEYGTQACHYFTNAGWATQTQTATTRPAASSSSCNSSTPATPGVCSPAQQCDQNVEATPNAACSFAENVFVAVWRGYLTNSQTTPQYVTAYDPTDHASYKLECGLETEVANIVCNVTNNQSEAVMFPLQAIQVYQGPGAETAGGSSSADASTTTSSPASAGDTVTSAECPSGGPGAGHLSDGTPCVAPPGTD